MLRVVRRAPTLGLALPSRLRAASLLVCGHRTPPPPPPPHSISQGPRRWLSAATTPGDSERGTDARPDTDRGVLHSIKAFFSREASVAPEGYNRWMMVPFSFLVQLSIGSVYAWSTFNAPLTRQLGVVVPAAADWSLGAVVPMFSICALSLGACTAFLGPWVRRHASLCHTAVCCGLSVMRCCWC
jgi:hypothetical protein